MNNGSSASPGLRRQEIDSKLNELRKLRESKACYPCRQRKVKCDSSHPCRTCQRRGHPEICAYDVEKSTPRRRAAQSRRRSDASRSSQPQTLLDIPTSPLEGPPSSRQPINESSTSYVFSGDNSLVSMLQQRDPDGSMAREAGSVLGLHNTYLSYPFMDIKSPEDRWRALLDILPHRNEVVKFFHFYRISAYPFNPILVDIDKFESDICSYLSSFASGEISDRNKVSDRWSSHRSIGHISLLLATLAAGAHFSDLEKPQRPELCQDFARRSFQALRLANFLFRPSLDIVQTLLILGNTLQNNGQSDAAWALLGTTVRLAQTLGLHTEKGISHWPEYAKSKAKALWSMTVWQDSLLSLCYDRPPIVATRTWTPDAVSSTQGNLSYTGLMHYLCWIALDITKGDESAVSEPSHSLELLAELDRTYSRAQPYLLRRDDCKNLQQHLEHLALRIHISFSVSMLCRPAIKSSQEFTSDPCYEVLRGRAKESLITASRAFLDFQALSVVPLRTWSMVHTVLSSTLILCIWQETRQDPECRELQQRVIEVFSTTDSSGTDTGSSDYSQWLSARHIRALITLRQNLRQRSDPAQPTAEINRQGLAPPSSSHQLPRDTVAQDMAMGGFPSYNDFFAGLGYGFSDGQNSGEIDFSPVTYLDSIMNVPLFDIPEDS